MTDDNPRWFSTAPTGDQILVQFYQVRGVGEPGKVPEKKRVAEILWSANPANNRVQVMTSDGHVVVADTLEALAYKLAGEYAKEGGSD